MARSSSNFGRGSLFELISTARPAAGEHILADWILAPSPREDALARGERKFDQLFPLCSKTTLGLVREFQNAVIRDLVERTMAASEQLDVESILVSGGVAANSQLRATFVERAKAAGVEVFFPSRALSTDNAAMIAAAAYSRLRAGRLADFTLNADPSLSLA